MSLDRRQLLRGSLAVGAAAVPIGGLAVPAHSAGRHRQTGQAPLAGFTLALLDAKNKVIENYNTADITTDAQGRSFFGAPTSTFSTGSGADAWDPLECKFRTLHSGESVFMVCGGDENNGCVTIHRKSDSAALGWARGIPHFFPHSLEYLPTADVIVVVGSRGLDDEDPPPEQLPGGPKPRSGGSFMLYTAPTKEGGPESFKRISDPRPFRQAHGVVRDQNQKDRVWIYGGDKIVGYTVSGWRETAKLEEAAGTRLPDQEHFENGHDLQPDPVDTQYLWATGSNFLLKINKSGGKPRLEWWQKPEHAKSFSRHRSGRGIYTADTEGNSYGSEKVELLWPAQTVTARTRGGQKEKWIYKARLTDI